MSDDRDGKSPETVQLQPTANKPTSYVSPSEEDDNYDPHDHRNVKAPTNNFETLVHLLKCSVGTGILAMPQAFARAGLVTGVISTAIIGIIITHCLHILIQSMYALCKTKRVPQLPYRDAMVVCFENGPSPLRPFAHTSALIVDTFLVVYQLGICCVYLVFIAGNNKQLFDSQKEMSIELHMLIILGPVIAINCIPNLKMLAPFSTLANILTLAGLGIVFYFITASKKSDQPLDLWGSITDFPLFFGTTLFALTAVGVVVALENSMKTPKSFGTPCGVLNIGMGVVTLLYMMMGVMGYVFCVSECKDSITMDLPQDSIATKVALVMYMIAIFISYALQCYVPVDILWNTYLKPNRERAGSERLVYWEYGLRIFLCLLTFLLAVSIPRLGLFISLFGALCLSALGIIFPAYLDICTTIPKSNIKLIKNIILMIVGVIGMIAGTYTAVLAIVSSFTTTA